MASIYSEDLKGLCNGILAWGDQMILNANNPLFMTSKNGTLEAIMSGINKSGFRQAQLSEANGKLLGKFRVAWTQRFLADDVTDSLDCDAPADKLPEYEQEYDVTNQIQSVGFTLQAADWQKICRDEKAVNDILGAYIMSDMNAARQALNERVADWVNDNLIGLNLANLVSDTPSASAKTLTILTTDGAARAQGLAQLNLDRTTNYLQGPLLMAGQGNLQMFLQLLQIGCCNDSGIDNSKVAEYMGRNGYGFFLDQYGNTAYGDNTCVVFAPGSLQLLTWNRFVGMYSSNIAGVKTFTMADPVIEGLVWDVLVKEVPCADGTGMPAYQFKLQLNYEPIANIPDDAYSGSDPLRGMNGIFLYEFAQEA